jgi:hypothetical protein
MTKANTTEASRRDRTAYRRDLTSSGASAEARRTAAVILEVLAGVRTPLGAAAALSIRPQRYYVLEARAVQGLVAACAPRTRGRTPSPNQRLTQSERELAAARRELGRQQALLRTLQRTLGPVPAASAGKAAAEGTAARRRQRRPTSRGLGAARVLRQEVPPGETTPPAVEPAAGGPAPR